MRCSIALSAALVLSLAENLPAQVSLTSAVPSAVAPGKTTEVVLHGAKLSAPLKIWTSFPCQTELVPAPDKAADETKVACRFTLSSQVPLGLGGLVVATSQGLSDVLYVMIDDLPNIADNGSNHAPANAQEIALPAGVDGQCDGTLFDYYRFSAKAGERISCEVVATRLGSDFDPFIRLLDTNGKELVLADDDPSAGPDPRFVFQSPADGTYLLELRDNRYKAGGRYRLRLGDFPVITTPEPLIVQRGTASPIEFSGPRTDGLTPFTVLVPGGTPCPTKDFPLSAPGRQASGWASVRTTDLPIFVENRSASPSAALTNVQLPGMLAGILESPRDRDVFQFTGKKGVRLTCRAITRSCGSAAILALRLLDGSGKQLSESPVTESDEPVLNFTFPADGNYQLAIEELAGRSGADYTYAVECRTGPQFTLSLKNDKNNRLQYAVPSKNGTFYLDVQCQRAGYDGPIVLSVESSRSGWQLVNGIIAAKATETRVYIVCPSEYSPGDVANLHIVGTGADAQSIASLSTLDQLRAARPQTPYPPSWHEGAMLVSGLESKQRSLRIGAGVNEVTLKSGGEAKLTLELQKSAGKSKDAQPAVLPIGLPAGITADVKRGGADAKDSYEVVLKADKSAAEGEQSLRFFAYAEQDGVGQAAFSGDIRLNIAAP